MYVQARQAIENIASALARAGADLSHVVRTRVFVTDLSRFGEVARAHQERFGANPPASSAVEVRRLVHPDMLVEIEADAYVVSAAMDPPSAAPANATAKPSAVTRKTVKPKAATKPKRVQKKSRPKRR